MAVCPSCGKENPDGFQFCGFCRAPLTEAPPAREQRKTVTVLFCDVTGSTALGEKLDPEPLRALLARYFEGMKQIVERHGGTVEKFIGDAVMAIFGVPVVHEDDALRAVRSALEMRAAFRELGVEGRVGVTTGEVVTGTEERLATGDAINVAARLEQAAQPGEVLIGEETLRLVRHAVDVEAVEPLALKGKAQRVPAYRLVSVRGEEGLVRLLEARMVGRERELDRLRDAFDQAARDRSCQLFTVLGAAGVGKSRLAAEFLMGVEGATLVRGRCLPYGEGITYSPVVEVIKQLPAVGLDERAAETIRGLLGEEPLVSASEEIAWAFRKLLEAVAAEQSLVCVFDDVHWGEETFLDLVEHIADLSREAPILLLCMARPELLDRRTGWGGGKVNATTILLEPLRPEETERLIDNLAELDAAVRERIREAAEGNPLFVEEMVAMLRESAGGEVSVPPSIQALLAARLDQLDPQERDVLQCGSVEGRVFHRGAVQALTPQGSQVTARLSALVRKELVRPEKPQLRGEDAFRFRHLLIRDAAYDALSKATRAELHERFAAWLEQSGQDLVELDELLGYHLEQAWRYRRELGEPDQAGGPLRERAGKRLAAAGRRARRRGDSGASVNLLGRAVALLDAASDIELELGEALFDAGRPGEAERLLGESAARSAGRGERLAELRARLVQTQIASSTDPEGKVSELLTLAEQAIPLFEAGGDEAGLMTAWRAIALFEFNKNHMDAYKRALERALAHAARARDELKMRELRSWLSAGYYYGSTPVEEALCRHETQRALEQQFPTLTSFRGGLEAMRGRFEEARALLGQARLRAAELGRHTESVALSERRWEVEMLAGDDAAAEREARWGCEGAEQMGERGWLSTQAGHLAQTLCALGRFDEAEEWSRKSEQLGASDDVSTQMLWRQARAKVLARRDQPDLAQRLAREAVALAEQTDMLNGQGDALVDLAEVLTLVGKTDEATLAQQQALALYERKGNIVMAERARSRLAKPREPSPAPTELA